MRLGFDSAGRLLEVVVLIFKNDDELVIHAMPARKQYRRLLPWR
ncbi:MAG: toxin-antitoxin system toxin subunit [Propionibacterium sp.]|nr:toxin-antitoxin system toxin subunit [Propionibacterium sp.]